MRRLKITKIKVIGLLVLLNVSACERTGERTTNLKSETNQQAVAHPTAPSTPVSQADSQLTLEEQLARINKIIEANDIEVGKQSMTEAEKGMNLPQGLALLRCSHRVVLKGSILEITTMGCGIGQSNNDSLTLEASVSDLDPDSIHIAYDSIIVIPCFKKARNCVAKSFLRSVDNTVGPGGRKKPGQYLSQMSIELQKIAEDENLKPIIFEEIKERFSQVIRKQQ